YEVLLLTDPVDEVWVDAVPEFEGKSLVSVAKGEVDLGGSVDDATEQGFAELLAWMGGALEEDVKEVRLSHRLTDSAACLVGEPGDLTPTLEKMYRAMARSRRRSNTSWSSTRSTGWSKGCAPRTRRDPTTRAWPT